MDVLILGGGASGRMAEIICKGAVILEQHKPAEGEVPHKRLTRNFGANYLWEKLPELACEPVEVVQTVDGLTAQPWSIKRYKRKIGKTYETSPEQLRELMQTQFEYRKKAWQILEWPEPENVLYGRAVTQINPYKMSVQCGEEEFRYNAVICTLPLPLTIDLLVDPIRFHCKRRLDRTPGLESQPINVAGYDWPTHDDDIKINYVSDEESFWYRTTTWRGVRQYEWLGRTVYQKPIETEPLFIRKIVPGKVYPNQEAAEIVRLLEERSIYCVGRFAQWQSDQLLHQTVERIRWISGRL
jgi:hypothetical protein